MLNDIRVLKYELYLRELFEELKEKKVKIGNLPYMSKEKQNLVHLLEFNGYIVRYKNVFIVKDRMLRMGVLELANSFEDYEKLEIVESFKAKYLGRVIKGLVLDGNSYPTMRIINISDELLFTLYNPILGVKIKMDYKEFLNE